MMAQSRFRSKLLWMAFALLFVLWGWHYAYHNKALGFSISRITSDFSLNPAWEIDPLPPEEQQKLDQILSQPFRYLSAGSQSYAFVSEDGKTVIKFFQMKHKVLHLRDYWTYDRRDERKEKLFSIYDSHKLAYEKMKEDAGLLYIHLNKTNHLHKKLQVTDRLHRTHLIDLDTVEFVVQERAELIFSRIKKLLEEKNQEGVRKAIAQVRHLVERRMQKGISDYDKAVKHNYGFVGDRAIQLDIGRIYLAERPEDLTHIQQRIDRWLAQQS